MTGVFSSGSVPIAVVARVYGYVPVDVVDALIKKHGGITKVRTLATPWSNGEETKSGDIGWREI